MDLVVGMKLAEGLRGYQITKVNPMTVEFLDCYPPGVALPRLSSRIGFEIGIEDGSIQVLSVPEKGEAE